MTEATSKQKPEQNKQKTEQKPRIFAHRGTSLLAPENTKAAFDLALRYHADVLETDVRLSKDGIVMVTHDESLERTTNGSGLVRDYTANELKVFDTAHGFTDLDNQPYTGEPVSMLTLSELFELYPTVGINIDIKDNDLIAANAVATVIQSRQSEGRLNQWINVGSFHASVIKQFRARAPKISTAATRQEVARLVFGSTKRVVPAYQLLQIPVAYWGIRLDGDRFINKVHRINCEVAYWTINDASNIQRLLKKGCNGVVTDRPDLALKAFEQLGLKSF